MRECVGRVDEVLRFYTGPAVQVHALRSRRAGRRAFVSLHVLVPGDWSVRRGHELVERVERDLRRVLGHATVFRPQ